MVDLVARPGKSGSKRGKGKSRVHFRLKNKKDVKNLDLYIYKKSDNKELRDN